MRKVLKNTKMTCDKSLSHPLRYVAVDTETRTAMTAPSTRPTVADLLRLRRSAPRTRAVHLATPGPEGMLSKSLSRAVAPGVRMLRRTVVETPAGRSHVPLVLESAGRRIAVLPDDAAGPASAEDAAMILVFGVFDVVYRVRRRALLGDVPGVAAEIAGQEPTLFDDESRRAMRLCALPRKAGATASDRPPVRPAAGSPMADVRVMRLKCPTEWADAFEMAMRSVEATRAPLFARSA